MIAMAFIIPVSVGLILMAIALRRQSERDRALRAALEREDSIPRACVACEIVRLRMELAQARGAYFVEPDIADAVWIDQPGVASVYFHHSHKKAREAA